MPLTCLPVPTYARLRAGWARGTANVGPASGFEAACTMLGLGGMLLAVVVTVAQQTFAPVLRTGAALRQAMAQADFDPCVCPDGWAAAHARRLGLTEAEVTAWYLREALRLSDEDVISTVGIIVARPDDVRRIEGAALARNQIVLCIAESRRLTTPPDQLVPPELRRGRPAAV